MLHKVQKVIPLPDFRLSVCFIGGETKVYDVKPLFDKIPDFKALSESPDAFNDVVPDIGGHGIIWNDDLDLSCDELWKNGIPTDK